MEPIDFIRINLSRLAINFPQIHIKYGFDEIIDTHVVELLPLNEYLNNQDLDKAWIPISIEFIKKFPNDTITFISSDSSLQVEKPIFELNIPTFDFQLIEDLFEYFRFNEIQYSYTFPEFIPSEIKIELPNSDVIGCPEVNNIEEKYSQYSYSMAA